MKLRMGKKMISCLLCMMLIVAIACMTAGCNTKKQEDGSQSATQAGEIVVSEDNILGEGQNKFFFTVVDKDGNETLFEIHTDEDMVGEALLALGLIEGEAGDYGLYVKIVNGIEADYDVDQTYWAFYINGEYANSGVDTTPITDGETYSFRVEK